MVLEARAPLGGPVLQLALLVQEVRQVGLLVAELPADLVEMATEVLQHIRVGSQLEAVHRRVAGDAPGPLVVVDDEEFARLGEEIIQAAGDDHVHIKEQRRAAQTMQVGTEGGQLGPAALGDARGQVQRRDGEALHLGADAGAVVGQADEMKVTAEMTAHHGVEAVDILGAVFRAPFHADHMALARRAGGCHRVNRPGAFSPRSACASWHA